MVEYANKNAFLPIKYWKTVGGAPIGKDFYKTNYWNLVKNEVKVI